MKIRNIIFDFDGTLLDTAPAIISTMQDTITELGLPERTDAQCKASIGLRLTDVPGTLFPEREGIADLFAASYRRIFNENAIKFSPRLFEGVAETLDLLAGEGYGMAVASSRSHRSLEEFVSANEMSDYFKMLIGGDDVANGKPAPDPVLKICSALGWNPAETLVVGDAAYDILMSKAAGCMTCGVSYGNGTVAELEKAGADSLIGSFTKLPEIIAQG